MPLSPRSTPPRVLYNEYYNSTGNVNKETITNTSEFNIIKDCKFKLIDSLMKTNAILTRDIDMILTKYFNYNNNQTIVKNKKYINDDITLGIPKINYNVMKCTDNLKKLKSSIVKYKNIIDKQKLEIERIHELRLCSICIESESSICFPNCNHCVTCRECFDKLCIIKKMKCPICRKSFDKNNIIEVLYS